jgi:hypothetical protein
LFELITYISVKLLKFEGAVSYAEIVSPSSNNHVEEFYHLVRRVAQSLVFGDEMNLRRMFIMGFGEAQI